MGLAGSTRSCLHDEVLQDNTVVPDKKRKIGRGCPLGSDEKEKREEKIRKIKRMEPRNDDVKEYRKI